VSDTDATDATYGPSAIRTPANGVTIGRLLASPGLFVLIAQDGATWGVFALWTGLALTDGLDGWMARRHGTTRSGAFLDPLADKVLVFGSLVMLVGIGTFWWLPVAIIGVREVAISLIRVRWGRLGLAIPATRLAKVKTFVQALAVGFALMPLTAEHAPWVATSLLWVAVVLTVVSGAQYVVAGRSATTTLGARTSPE
jgi:CDP-diacylglycerol--glycerol-3-phosphate 3-phosphatidyltransferase